MNYFKFVTYMIPLQIIGFGLVLCHVGESLTYLSDLIIISNLSFIQNIYTWLQFWDERDEFKGCILFWKCLVLEIHCVSISSFLHGNGLLLHQLVPVQTWSWKVYSCKCWPFPLYTPNLCFFNHQPKKRACHLWVEWRCFLQVIQGPQKHVCIN